MQKQLVIIGLAVVGLVAIWQFQDSDDQTDSVASSPTPATKALSSDSDINEAISERVEGANATEKLTPSTAASPFSVTEQAVLSTPADVISAPLTETINEANSPFSAINSSTTNSASSNAQSSSSGTDSNLSTVVVVPDSYPASDAAKYFVPAGERRAGNLGGPPPLPFSDPATGPLIPSGGGFTPPNAPGQ